MKKILNIFLLLFLTGMTLSGCVKPDDIQILGVKDMDISMSGLSPLVSSTVTVENSSGSNITIKNAHAVITDRSGTTIVTANIDNDLLLPKRKTTDLNIPVALTINNPLKAVSLARSINSRGHGFFVTGSVTMKAGCAKKTFKLENVPLPELVRYLDSMQSLKQDLKHQLGSGQLQLI